MAYDPERKAFICERCGPGLNKFKYSSYWILKPPAGDVYCVVHDQCKIGNLSEVSEGRINATRRRTKASKEGSAKANKR